MEAFGELALADFIDLNKNEQVYDLPFTKQIRRCNDVIRKIEYLQEVCISHGINQKRISTIVDFKEARDALKSELQTSKYGIFDMVEKRVDEKEDFINDQIKSIKDMHHSYNYLIEYKEVLEKVRTFMAHKPSNVNSLSNPFSDDGQREARRTDSDENLFGNRSSGSLEEGHGNYSSSDNYRALNLSSLAGIINRVEVQRLKRIVFRASRGNALVHTIPIIKPIKEYTGEVVDKDVYIITFQDGEILREKLTKICDSFTSEKFEIPTTSFEAKLDHVKSKISETRGLINNTTDQVRKYLEKVCKLEETHMAAIGISRLSLYKMIAEYDKTVYGNLNKLVSTGSLFQGYFWSLKGRNEIIDKLDLEGTASRELEITEIYDHEIPPPTYFRTNEFLAPFQEIVNTYGVPVYKEANPAVFTIVSFPFLFGVMFGDVGHGGLVLLFSIFLCLFSQRLKDTALKPMVEVRFLLLMLGFFSTFCGFIYNDFMSIPIQLWDSCYIKSEGDIELQPN